MKNWNVKIISMNYHCSCKYPLPWMYRQSASPGNARTEVTTEYASLFCRSDWIGYSVLQISHVQDPVKPIKESLLIRFRQSKKITK